MISKASGKRLGRVGQIGLLALAALLTLGTHLTPASATNVITTIPADNTLNTVAGNSVTNRIYATTITGTLSVIDGSSNTVITRLPINNNIFGVAVNSHTNRAYVLAGDGVGSIAVYVVSGETNTVIDTITLCTAQNPCTEFSYTAAIAVNPVTNRIYARLAQGGINSGAYIAIIDANNNTVIGTFNPRTFNGFLSNVIVDPINNRIYVTEDAADAASQLYYTGIDVYDGTSNAFIVTKGVNDVSSGGLAFNSTSNQLYFAYCNSNNANCTVAVWDGNLTPLTTIAVDKPVVGIVANPNTNRVYFDKFGANNANGTVLTINGNTNTILSTTEVGVNPTKMDVNPNTNRVYVANSGSNTISVLGEQATALVATAGNEQTTTTSSNFATPLVATLKDASGQPVANTSVTFSAPTSGASGTFANGQTTFTTQTNANGQASASFKANATTGIYYVTASVSVPNSGTLKTYFNLTNATPAAITPLSGSGQSAVVGTAFGQPLTAKVTDASSHPLNGATVVFQGPTGGASATFSGTYTVTADASGVVTSPVFSANTVAGNYSITANAGTGSATFSETNLPGPPAGLVANSGGNQGAVINTAFGQPLVATVVDSYNNPVSTTVNVTFTVPISGSGASAVFTGGLGSYSGSTNSKGQVSSASLLANGVVGSYTVTANAAGVSNPISYTLFNVDGCGSVVVTNTLDDGSCGTLRQAVAAAGNTASSTVTITLNAGSTISLTNGVALPNSVTVTTTASCGSAANGTLVPPITLKGIGSASGDGLTLAGNNRLYGLWVRGFSGVQIKAPAGSHTVMQCVKASKN